MKILTTQILLSMKDVISYVTKLPIWLNALIIFTIVPIWIFKDSIGSLIKKIPINKLRIFKKKEPIVIEKIVYVDKLKDYSIKDLLHHDFFITLNDLDSRIRQIDFSDKAPLNRVKRTMMIKLMDYKVKSIKKHFNELINDENISDLPEQVFKFKVIEKIRCLIGEYNDEAIDYYINEMNITREDANFFVNSYESYRTTIIESFVNRIESICVSNSYSSNYERMLALFEILTVAIEVIPRDIKSLYSIINGRYDKYLNKEQLN